ncbi:hypothetical protein CRG98_003424 [Punica granatum]|uniref:Uncharacterized protein n=1 Tax=Punica granatum TaxID=22663 RepID=A0A2I0L661_PUNGR|nr:hypothetical protein CRG98_003424 [Punica granatum]
MVGPFNSPRWSHELGLDRVRSAPHGLVKYYDFSKPVARPHLERLDEPLYNLGSPMNLPRPGRLTKPPQDPKGTPSLPNAREAPEPPQGLGGSPNLPKAWGGSLNLPMPEKA